MHCPHSHPGSGVRPILCFRSLVDTVYALKDEVQELRQVSPDKLLNLVTGSEESTV